MRIKRLLKCLSFVVAAAGLSACANITYDRDNAIAIPAGATVAFSGGRSEGRENLDPATGNDVVHRRIQSAIVTQLEASGFKLVTDAETADFVVRYFVGVQRGAAPPAAAMNWRTAPTMNSGWGWGWGGGTVTTITPLDFTEVSVALDLVQRSTGRTAWRAVWRSDQAPRAPTQQEIDDAMARIFSSAPAAR